MDQPAERRRHLRRAINYPAYIDLGNGTPLRECTLCDASQDGAQLLVADPDKLADQFILALSSDGAARRNCRVIWRSGNQIGVEFIKAAKKPLRSRVPYAMRQLLQSAVTKPADEADQVDIDALSQRQS